MQFSSCPPHPLLRDYIHFYWVGLINLQSQKGLIVSIQPITMQNLLFFPNDIPIRMNEGKEEEMNSCTLIGMISKPSAYLLKGNIKIVGVRFTPLGFSKFYSVPPQEFTNHARDFRLIQKLEMDELSERIESEKPDTERFKIFDTYFLNKLNGLKSRNNNEGNIQWSVSKIIQSKGNLKVETLPQDLKISKRHFRRIFLEATGLSPKTFADITRYNEAYKLILDSEKKDWFEIIHRCGYHDQSHFIHDFKKFTGKPPASFESDFKDFDRFHRS